MIDTILLYLTYLCLFICFVDVFLKVKYMIDMKKLNRWCPRNKWYYSRDYNDAVSHGWYKTIEIAESIRQNRKNLTVD